MKRNIKISLIIIISIILILIPAIVLAINIFKIPVKIPVTDEYALRQAKLKEKAEITNQLKESNLNNSNTISFHESDMDILENKDSEQEEIKLRQIIEKFNKTF